MDIIWNLISNRWDELISPILKPIVESITFWKILSATLATFILLVFSFKDKIFEYYFNKNRFDLDKSKFSRINDFLIIDILNLNKTELLS